MRPNWSAWSKDRSRCSQLSISMGLHKFACYGSAKIQSQASLLKTAQRHKTQSRLLTGWMENFDSAEKPLVPTFCSCLGGKKAHLTLEENVIVQLSLRFWNQFRHCFGLPTCSSLAGDLIFSWSSVEGTFNIWWNLGIEPFKELYVDNNFVFWPGKPDIWFTQATSL